MLSKAWPAPAKLNLFLHITGQRHDGYHLLQTLFQFIDLMDYIDFRLLDDDIIIRKSTLPDISPEDDIVVRAARKLKSHTRYRHGVEINLSKHIPIGGGLGGGSSNAATTLVALNHLWQTNLDKDELAAMGLELGADVPVFVRGQAAWAEGVGETLTPLETEEGIYLVVHPGCHVSTAEVFNSPDLTRHTPAITIRDFLENSGHNDCEAVVRKRYNEVARALDWLAGYAPAKLTGTGSCVFAAFSSGEQANTVKDELPENWRAYVVRGINRSPLWDRVEEQTKS